MKTTTTPSGTGRARLGLIVSMTVFGTIGLFVRRIEITSAELSLCRGSRPCFCCCIFSSRAGGCA